MAESTENSLYNFKSKKKYFLEILQKFEFTPRYNRENIRLDDNSSRPVIDIVTPMICWCDIPLKRIKSHTSRYGDYGIGISKEWAIRNRINPIIYVIEGTDIAKSFSKIKDLHIELGELMDSDNNLKKKILHITGGLFSASNYLTQYIKPYSYQGGSTKQEKRKFYDEKEWRYVPDPIHPLENLLIFPAMFNNDENGLEKAITKANEYIKNRALFFEPDDVQIIITKKQEEKIEIIECLRNTCKSKGFEEELESLIDKVKTIDEIN